MAFLNIRFPSDISLGGVGGPGYSTDVIEVRSGYEQRNSNWSASRNSFDVSHAARSPAQVAALIAFFRIAKGKANAFRYKDWMDYTCTDAQGRLGTGVGDNTLIYPMNKLYTNSAGNDLRKISRPVSGTVQCFKNAILLVEGVADGNISINHSTGIVTFVTTAPAPGDVLTWSGEFDVPCRFDVDQLKGELIAPGTYGWSGINIVEIRE